MLKDQEAPRLDGIVARKHSVRYTRTQRTSYPFRAMLVNDYFVVQSLTASINARDAAKTYCRRHGGNKKFSVRQMKEFDGVWIVRRIA